MKKETKNPLITGIVGMGFDFIKHLIKDFEQAKSIKKIDKVSEHFSTIEHLILKMESKVEDNRREIESLKNRLVMAMAVIIAMLIVITVQVF